MSHDPRQPKAPPDPEKEAARARTRVEVGKILFVARTEAGARQREWAGLVGVSTPLYCQVERGVRSLPMRWLEHLPLSGGMLAEILEHLR